MTVKSYLNLYELLELNSSTREENRAFGLSHRQLKNNPTKQLILWSQTHKSTLPKPLLSETFSSALYSITLTLVIFAFILGLFSGMGLLSYNGREPINVIYFIAIVIFLPLMTMMLTFLSMLRANASQSSLIHISPAFWMEKILNFLPKKIQENLENFKVSPLLSNWLIIKRSQLLALFFSLGLLVALLGIVSTRDMAFAWSTTLDITAEEFHQFLYALAFAWRDFVPSAVPTLWLIEHSQYYRLGDSLSQEMIANASQLGQWWKFLAMATFFYALVLRFLMYVLTYMGFQRAIKKSILTLGGIPQLLGEMNDPIISTHRGEEQSIYVYDDKSYTQILYALDSSYDVIQGWAMNQKELVVLSDSMRVISPYIVDVGGANSLAEDSSIIAKSKGEVLLFVKAWEPPTMDFLDYLEELTQKVTKVLLVPVGTIEESYHVKQKYMDIWSRKLLTVTDEKVWLKC